MQGNRSKHYPTDLKGKIRFEVGGKSVDSFALFSGNPVEPGWGYIRGCLGSSSFSTAMDIDPRFAQCLSYWARTHKKVVSVPGFLM